MSLTSRGPYRRAETSVSLPFDPTPPPRCVISGGGCRDGNLGNFSRIASNGSPPCVQMLRPVSRVCCTFRNVPPPGAGEYEMFAPPLAPQKTIDGPVPKL